MNDLPTDEQLKALGTWRSRLAWWLHYPCYVVLVLRDVAAAVGRAEGAVDGGT